MSVSNANTKKKYNVKRNFFYVLLIIFLAALVLKIVHFAPKAYAIMPTLNDTITNHWNR